MAIPFYLPQQDNNDVDEMFNRIVQLLVQLQKRVKKKEQSRARFRALTLIRLARQARRSEGCIDCQMDHLRRAPAPAPQIFLRVPPPTRLPIYLPIPGTRPPIVLAVPVNGQPILLAAPSTSTSTPTVVQSAAPVAAAPVPAAPPIAEVTAEPTAAQPFAEATPAPPVDEVPEDVLRPPVALSPPAAAATGVPALTTGIVPVATQEEVASNGESTDEADATAIPSSAAEESVVVTARNDDLPKEDWIQNADEPQPANENRAVLPAREAPNVFGFFFRLIPAQFQGPVVTAAIVLVGWQLLR